jgi:hypothetical protein
MGSKRRLAMFNWMTANGCFAGADGNLDWVVPDEQQSKAAVDGIPLFDTVLFGHRTTNSSRNSGTTLSTTPPRHRTRTISDNQLGSTAKYPFG